MKGSCNYQPAGIIEYGKTGTGQVLFNIERNDLEVDGEMRENWDFESVEVNNFKRDTIIAAVIRAHYSQDEAEAILANYAQRKSVGEYLTFQEWRNLAKGVADGKRLKSELSEHYTKQLIKVTMPLSFVLSGGKYEVLADRAMKLMCPYEISVVDGVEMVTTWLAYIEPEHQHIQEDVEVAVEMVNLL